MVDSDPFAEDEARKKAADQLLQTSDNSGINFDAYDDIPVEATGRDCPNAITTFEEASPACPFSSPNILTSEEANLLLPETVTGHVHLDCQCLRNMLLLHAIVSVLPTS